MKKLFSLTLLFLLLPLPGAPLPDTVARFGNLELKKERFQHFELSENPVLRRKQLKQLVDTEVWLIIIRRLLGRSGIVPDEQTAKRYIEMRKKQFAGKVPPESFKALEANAAKADFQLKCALYFTFYAADPATVEPTSEEIMRHYELNKEQFRLPPQRVLSIFKAGKTLAEGKKNAPLILARLRQGEDFQSLAKQFDPEGRKKDTSPEPGVQLHFKKVKEMAQGEVASVETPQGVFIVKVISITPGQFRPVGETLLFVTEKLSSARQKSSLEQYMREILAKTPVQYFF